MAIPMVLLALLGWLNVYARLKPLLRIRFAIEPICEGYPDVDTYRDHEFYVIG
jgi:hypothetical protein